MALGSMLGLLFATFSNDKKENRGKIFAICWIITCVSYGLMMYLDFIGLVMYDCSNL